MRLAHYALCMLQQARHRRAQDSTCPHSLCFLLAVYARSGHGHLSFVLRCRRARAVCAGDLTAPGAKFLRAEPAAFAAFALVLTRSVVAASARGGHRHVCAQPAAHQIPGKSFSVRINAYALRAHALVILGIGAKPTVRVCLFDSDFHAMVLLRHGAFAVRGAGELSH